MLMRPPSQNARAERASFGRTGVAVAGQPAVSSRSRLHGCPKSPAQVTLQAHRAGLERELACRRVRTPLTDRHAVVRLERSSRSRRSLRCADWIGVVHGIGLLANRASMTGGSAARRPLRMSIASFTAAAVIFSARYSDPARMNRRSVASSTRSRAVRLLASAAAVALKVAA